MSKIGAGRSIIGNKIHNGSFQTFIPSTEEALDLATFTRI